MTAALHPAPVAIGVFDERTADAWRISAQGVAEGIRFCRQYAKVIAERDARLSSGHLVHSPAYVERAEKLLPWRLSLYLECLRKVSECEAKMIAVGMPFALSSDAWGA